jgi:hypothetical protein
VSDEPTGDDGSGPGREPLWLRLIAPLRSEDAAFRVVIWAAAAALVVLVLVLLVRLVS